jgi:DNA polymerase-3 subunit beta
VRFQVDSDAFAEAVGWTARCLPGRPPVPILAGMLLELESDRLTMSAFDHEVAAVGGLAVAGTEPGRVLVSGRLLADIARSLPAAPVHVESGPAKLLVRCGGTRFTLQTLPVEDYPALPGPPPLAGTVGADAVAAAVGQVCVAAARDDALPVLAGVRVELRGGSLVLSCTDRFRVAVRELTWRPERADIQAVALVPARTLTTTARWLTAGAEVRIGLGSDGLIGCGDRSTVSRLLDHQPVDYPARLPREHAGRVEVDTAALLDAVRRVALVAAKHTPVRVGVGAGRMVLEANTGDEAHAIAELPADIEGAELTMAFNPQWLLDGVAAVESDTTRLAYTAPGRPALISGKSTDGFRYLLMPVRLPGHE